MTRPMSFGARLGLFALIAIVMLFALAFAASVVPIESRECVTAPYDVGSRPGCVEVLR